MTKIALLIGVSNYGLGLNSLPSALKDIEALQNVLQQKDIGSFDEVKLLPNPSPDSFRESVENLFQDRNKNDLILLFFSGHGITDDRGQLHFSTCKTEKSESGILRKSTAVSARFIQDIMGDSKCKRQVLILDCCNSGAFPKGMTAKDDGTIDIKSQLGGEGKVILTSSTASQYSFETSDSELSVYSRFIIEGLQTGTADINGDGIVSIKELHDYASKKVRDAVPSMKPKIFAFDESFSIHIANAPVDDPQLTYRREVEHFAKTGEISSIGREALNAKQSELSIPPQTAARIEKEVLKPYKEHQQNRIKYEKAFTKAVKKGLPLSNITRQELTRLKDALGLEKTEVEAIQSKIFPKPPQPASNEVSIPTSETKASAASAAKSQMQNNLNSGKKIALIGGISIAGLLSLVILGSIISRLTPAPDLTILPPSSGLSTTGTTDNSPEENPEAPVVPKTEPDPLLPKSSSEPIALNPARKYRDPDGLFVVGLPEGYEAMQEHGDGFGSLLFNSKDEVVIGLLIASSSVDIQSQSRQEIISRISNDSLGFSVTEWNSNTQHSLNSWSWGFEAVGLKGQELEGFTLFLDDGQDILTAGLILILYSPKGVSSDQHSDDVMYIIENLRFKP